LQQLQREACDSGQGYLLARPLTADAVSRLIAVDGDRSDGNRSEALEENERPRAISARKSAARADLLDAEVSDARR
jgi:hypothetical protein